MYVSDLSLITKARLQETQNVALSQPNTRHPLRWVRRALLNAVRR